MPLGPPVQERLVRFVPAEWSGDLAEAYAAWKTARRDYSGHLPAGARNPLGDVLDRLRAEREARRHWQVAAR